MSSHPNGVVAAAVDAAVVWYFQENPLEAALLGSDDPAHTRTLGDHSAEGRQWRRARTLKQFHDTIAGAGGLPLGLARRVALRSALRQRCSSSAEP